MKYFIPNLYGLEYIFFISVVLSLFCLYQSSYFVSINSKPQIHYHVAIGDGPSSDCFITFNLNVIDSAIEFITCHLSFIFDDYVSFTPNLLGTTTQTDLDYQSILYKNMQKLGLILIPILLIFSIAKNLIESSLDFNVKSKTLEYIQKFIQNVILLILLPTIFKFIIDINNSICQYIINIISSKSESLSQLIVNAININEIAQNQFIPSIASTILLVAFFISIIFIAIFFIMRFILIWILFLTLPVLIVLDEIPTIKGIRDGIMARIVQFIIVQPVFLLGVGFFLVLMKEDIDSISKFIIAICSLFTIGFIPGMIAGVSGNRVVSASIHKMQELTEGFIERVDFFLKWANESLSKPYELPIIKPDKK